MTVPYKRTRALMLTNRLLKHYPSYSDIEQAHKALPDVFGPVPPFNRLKGTADVQGVIDATKGES